VLVMQTPGGFDIAMEGGDLVGDDSLATAVLVSLFTDVRAGTDELPPEFSDRRGFWGDALLARSGDASGVGSKLWLLFREKQTASVVAAAEDYARRSLRWLITDGIAEAVDVRAESNVRGRMDLQISIKRKTPALIERAADSWTVTVDGETASIQETQR